VTKINNVENGAKKLKRYKKYFHRDSLRWVKDANRYWKRESDSIRGLVSAREHAWQRQFSKINVSVESRTYKTVYYPWAQKQAFEHLRELKQSRTKTSAVFDKAIYALLLHYFLQVSQNDSMLLALKKQAPYLLLPKQFNSRLNDYLAIHPEKRGAMHWQQGRGWMNGKILPEKDLQDISRMKVSAMEYSSAMKKYSQYGTVLRDKQKLMGVASLNSEQYAKGYLARIKGYNELQQSQKDMEMSKGLANQYKEQNDHLQDSAYMKEQAKKKAEGIAMDYISQHPEAIQAVQKKMALLMKK
jgi:hypothetical protein